MCPIIADVLQSLSKWTFLTELVEQLRAVDSSGLCSSRHQTVSSTKLSAS